MKLTLQQRIDLIGIIPQNSGSYAEMKQGYRLKNDLKITEAYKKHVEWTEANGQIRYNPYKDDFTLDVDDARREYIKQIIDLAFESGRGVPNTLDEIVIGLMEQQAESKQEQK